MQLVFSSPQNSRHSQNSRRRRRGGQVIVEFAFVAVMLVVLFLGIMQFGLVYFTASGINNAAREGARFGSVRVASQPTATAAKSLVREFVRGKVGGVVRRANLTDDKIRIRFLGAITSLEDDSVYGTQDTRMEVTVEHTVGSFLPIPGIREFRIVRTSTMRVEGIVQRQP